MTRGPSRAIDYKSSIIVGDRSVKRGGMLHWLNTRTNHEITTAREATRSALDNPGGQLGDRSVPDMMSSDPGT